MRRVLMLVALLGGCGYHFAGVGTHVPADARTIVVGRFANRTRDHGLEVRLRRAVEDEFRRQGTLKVVADESDADLVLSGTVRRFTSVPVASGAADDAVQYQGTIVIGVRLVERRSGRVLYETNHLAETEEIAAVSGVVITSSPRFQRGTIDARDLIDLNNVQLGDARRRAASQELLDLLARDVYIHAMEGF
jgi:hypothetical protein